MNSVIGYRSIELPEDETGIRFPVHFFYPTEAVGRAHAFGPFTLDVAVSAPAAPGPLRLVVISHGTGGSPLNHRTLAAHLAASGFVVAMPEHPRNNRNNNDLAGTGAILRNRPRHVSLVMDRAFSEVGFGASLDGATAAVIGHSLGGYTALAVAGGRATAFPWEAPDGQPRAVEVTRDERVGALVLLAPAAAWFLTPGSLSDVRVPILMLTGEKDEVCETTGTKTLPNGAEIYVPEGHSAIIKRGLGDQSLLEHRVVGNAGHFSFLSPFPASMVSPSFPPSQDPEGFDRVGFHAELNDEVLSFLERTGHRPD